MTVYDAKGRATFQTVPIPRRRPVDCFYVYPTVSMQRRGNSTLQITDAESITALAQAAQFENVCRVFAPMYHQVPVDGAAYHPNYELEYDDVLAAWRDYLAHDNGGRGVVLIGHSEGAFLLKRLIREQIEGSAAERRLFVSAILLGGDVTVANGSDTGGDFRSVRACRETGQTGCVVAYSSWDRTPPADASFEQASPGQHVLCVNPAALAGGSAPITPIFPWYASGGLVGTPSRRPVTTFLAFPDLYTALCVQQGTRAWLLIERITSPLTDPRPTVQDVAGPSWGLHPADVNLTLGNLIELVRIQSNAWLAHH
jgi:hypothetical protein